MMHFSVQMAGPLEEKAMVMGVMDKAFDIFVLKLGVSKRVYCDVSQDYKLLYTVVLKLS